MANETTYTNLLVPAAPLTIEAIEKATREIEPIAAEIRRLDAEIARRLGIPGDRVKYLTGNWSVSPDDDQQPMTPERAAQYAQLHALVREDVPSPFAPVIDPFAITELTRRYMETLTAIVEPIVAHLDDRYPHTCPRCQGPAYVGAVEVDCAGNCK